MSLRDGTLLTIADGRLTVRLSRDLWQLEPRHVELARAVSAVAQEHGGFADRSAVQEVQLAIAAKPDAVDVAFWRAVLGYAPMADDNAIDPLGHGSTVWMQELDGAKPLRHAMHIDVSVAREQVEARLAAALAAGGRIVDDSEAPSHWTLSDRAGNRVCICAWPDGTPPRASTRTKEASGGDMGNVVIDMSMSLDGYIAAPNGHPGQGLGEDGMRLHNWGFDSGWGVDRAHSCGSVTESALGVGKSAVNRACSRVISAKV